MPNLFIKGIEVPEKSYLDNNFFTQSYINTNYYTNSYINNTFLTKTDANSNFLNKTNRTSYTPTGNYNPATKKYVDDCIAAIRQLHFEIVEELPAVGDPTIIYMILAGDGTGEDYYDEYIYINDTWEKIGSTRIDLSPYYTAAEVDEILEGYTSKYVCTESEYAGLSPEQKAAYDLFIINPDPIPEPITLDLREGSYDFGEQKVTINNISREIKSYLTYTRNGQVNRPATVVWRDGVSITNVISADQYDNTKYYFHVKGICPQSASDGWRDNFFFAFYLNDDTLEFELKPSAYTGYDIINWTIDDMMCTIELQCEENDEIQFLDRDVNDNHILFTIYGDLNHTFVARAHVVPRYRWYRNGELLKECVTEIDQDYETWDIDNVSKDPIDCYITLYGFDPNNINTIECEYVIANDKTVPPTSGFTIIGEDQIKVPVRRRLGVRFIITDINEEIYVNDEYVYGYGFDTHDQAYMDWWF